VPALRYNAFRVAMGKLPAGLAPFGITDAALPRPLLTVDALTQAAEGMLRSCMLAEAAPVLLLLHAVTHDSLVADACPHAAAAAYALMLRWADASRLSNVVASGVAQLRPFLQLTQAEIARYEAPILLLERRNATADADGPNRASGATAAREVASLHRDTLAAGAAESGHGGSSSSAGAGGSGDASAAYQVHSAWLVLCEHAVSSGGHLQVLELMAETARHAAAYRDQRALWRLAVLQGRACFLQGQLREAVQVLLHASRAAPAGCGVAPQDWVPSLLRPLVHALLAAGHYGDACLAAHSAAAALEAACSVPLSPVAAAESAAVQAAAAVAVVPASAAGAAVGLDAASCQPSVATAAHPGGRVGAPILNLDAVEARVQALVLLGTAAAAFGAYLKRNPRMAPGVSLAEGASDSSGASGAWLWLPHWRTAAAAFSAAEELAASCALSSAFSHPSAILQAHACALLACASEAPALHGLRLGSPVALTADTAPAGAGAQQALLAAGLQGADAPLLALRGLDTAYAALAAAAGTVPRRRAEDSAGDAADAAASPGIVRLPLLSFYDPTASVTAALRAAAGQQAADAAPSARIGAGGGLATAGAVWVAALQRALSLLTRAEQAAAEQLASLAGGSAGSEDGEGEEDGGNGEYVERSLSLHVPDGHRLPAHPERDDREHQEEASTPADAATGGASGPILQLHASSVSRVLSARLASLRALRAATSARLYDAHRLAALSCERSVAACLAANPIARFMRRSDLQHSRSGAAPAANGVLAALRHAVASKPGHPDADGEGAGLLLGAADPAHGDPAILGSSAADAADAALHLVASGLALRRAAVQSVWEACEAADPLTAVEASGAAVLQAMWAPLRPAAERRGVVAPEPEAPTGAASEAGAASAGDASARGREKKGAGAAASAGSARAPVASASATGRGGAGGKDGGKAGKDAAPATPAAAQAGAGALVPFDGTTSDVMPLKLEQLPPVEHSRLLAALSPAALAAQPQAAGRLGERSELPSVPEAAESKEATAAAMQAAEDVCRTLHGRASAALFRGLSGCLDAASREAFAGADAGSSPSQLYDAAEAAAAELVECFGTRDPLRCFLALATYQSLAARRAMLRAFTCAAAAGGGSPNPQLASMAFLARLQSEGLVCAADTEAAALTRSLLAQSSLAFRLLDIPTAPRPLTDALACIPAGGRLAVVQLSASGDALYLGVCVREAAEAASAGEGAAGSPTHAVHVAASLPSHVAGVRAVVHKLPLAEVDQGRLQELVARVRSIAEGSGADLQAAVAAAAEAEGGRSSAVDQAAEFELQPGGNRAAPLRSARAPLDAVNDKLTALLADFNSFAAPLFANAPGAGSSGDGGAGPARPQEVGVAALLSRGAPLVLCVDPLLAELPWEGLSGLAQACSCMTRDFSLHVHAARAAAGAQLRQHGPRALTVRPGEWAHPADAPSGGSAAPSAAAAAGGCDALLSNLVYICDPRGDETESTGDQAQSGAYPSISSLLRALVEPPPAAAGDVPPSAGAGKAPPAAKKDATAAAKAASAGNGGKPVPSAAESTTPSDASLQQGEPAALHAGSPLLQLLGLPNPVGSLAVDGAGLRLASEWSGVVGAPGSPLDASAMLRTMRSAPFRAAPAPATAEAVAPAAGAAPVAGGGLIAYGHGRLLSHVAPQLLAQLTSLPGLRFALLLDAVSNGSSGPWASQQESVKRGLEGRLQLEGAWGTAALLTLQGVGAIVVNQWASTPAANHALLSGVLTAAAHAPSVSLAQAVWRTFRDPAALLPHDGRAVAPGSAGPPPGVAKLRVLLNPVVYGLPHLSLLNPRPLPVPHADVTAAGSAGSGRGAPPV
jgi:hypothetical protein